MSTQLITQLIVLATALVGLYKAATYHRPDRSGHDDGVDTEVGGQSAGVIRSIVEKFDGLFDLAALFLFMLAFPAFVYAFFWVMSSIPNLLNDPVSSEIEMPKIEIGPDATDTQLMLRAAVEMRRDFSRDNQLEEIVDRALEEGEYRLAIKAASAISRQFTRDNEMEKIIKALAANPERAGNGANKTMQPTAESGG